MDPELRPTDRRPDVWTHDEVSGPANFVMRLFGILHAPVLQRAALDRVR
jgi:hypothetical protein